MKKNMKKWLADMVNEKSKKAIPILSFPCVSLLDVSVKELISDSALQAKGMKLIAEKIISKMLNLMR